MQNINLHVVAVLLIAVVLGLLCSLMAGPIAGLLFFGLCFVFSQALVMEAFRRKTASYLILNEALLIIVAVLYCVTLYFLP